MEATSPRLNSFHCQSDATKRVACNRCRTQKLKCVRSTTSAILSRCDRCRKADAECIYAPSKPMGRPKTSRSRTMSRTMQCSTLPSNTTASEQSTGTPTETLDPSNIVDEGEPTLDTQSMNMFFDHITPFEQSDTSTRNGLEFLANDMDFLTPDSSHATLCFSNASDTYVGSIAMDDEAAGDHVGTAASSTASDSAPRSSMQHLAKLGLDLHAQIAKHQKAGDAIIMEDLIADVLRSSTDYLNILSSLDNTFVASQDSRVLGGTRWVDGTLSGQASQLDISAAFQLLIPYVRLVQLHNILYRAMLRCLDSGSSTNSTKNICRSGTRTTVLWSLPALTVGGACVDASDPLRARLLLQINLHLLAEIETTLELPLEARIYWTGVEGGMGGVMGNSVNEQGGSCGLLRKAVSSRLLKTILEERNLGADDVQSMRDRISYIKRLLRSSRLWPL